MIRMVAPQLGQRVPSRSKILDRRAAHVRRWARTWGVTSAPGSRLISSATAGDGTICWRTLALGARTPWYRIKLSRGGGTSAANFSSSSNGDSSRWVVPSDHGVFKRKVSCSSSMICRRPAAKGGRVA